MPASNDGLNIFFEPVKAILHEALLASHSCTEECERTVNNKIIVLTSLPIASLPCFFFASEVQECDASKASYLSFSWVTKKFQIVCLLVNQNAGNHQIILLNSFCTNNVH